MRNREGSEVQIHVRAVRVVINEDVPGSSNADAFWCVVNFYQRFP